MPESRADIGVEIQSTERTIPVETAKSNALMAMADQGLLRFDMNNDITCDGEKFRSLKLKDFRTELTQVSGNTSTVDGLFKLFDGMDVFMDDNPEKQPLFALPQHGDIAPESIKAIKGHLKPWDVIKTNLPVACPTAEEGFASNLSMKEYQLMDLIYGEGQGERDQQGVLWVTKDGVRKPISGDYFSRFGQEVIASHPSRWFKDNVPHWLEKGWITKGDFREQAGGEGDQVRTLRKTTQDKGMVMLDRVRYTLGTEHADCDIVTLERGNVAAIVREKKVVKLFRLADLSEKGDPYRQVNKSEIEFIDPETIPSIVNVIENDSFGKFLDYSERLERDFGIDLSMLSVREQSITKQVMEQYQDAPDFWEFIRHQGEDGLRTLLVAENNIANVASVLEIGERGDTGFLFENVSNIIRTVGNYEDISRLHDGLSSDEQTRTPLIGDAVISHASELFLAAYEVAKNNPQAVSMQDASHALYCFRRQVDGWYSDHYARAEVLSIDRYQQLLDAFDTEAQSSEIKPLLLSMIQEYWKEGVAQEALRSSNGQLAETMRRITDFYDGNKELFATADESTGDTQQELEMLGDFFDTHEVEDMALDLACGDGKRITEPMATMLQGRAKVMGLDIWPTTQLTHENAAIVRGSIDAIPLPSHSVGTITLNWSPPNDWVTTTEQWRNFREIGRVAKDGATLRMDLAHLEGGEGGWMSTAQEQYEADQVTFGNIQVLFPGGREGSFHIYPMGELKAFLADAGFGAVEVKPWKTKAGKPRVIVEAKYTGQSSPLA